MKYLIDNDIFDIPSLKLGIENGIIYDYATFKKFYDVKLIFKPKKLDNIQHN